nr:MAG TPA: Maltose-binding periplasmic protein [Caudoviricetes sp.]
MSTTRICMVEKIQIFQQTLINQHFELSRQVT